MPRIRFLATATDPRPDHPATTYGPGHETDYVTEDHEFIKSLLLEGKAELLDGPPPPALFAAPQQGRLESKTEAKAEAKKT